MENRVLDCQMHVLLDYLEEHRDVASVYMKAAGSRKNLKSHWNDLAIKLNSITGGCAKTGKRWNQYWNDMKYKVRCKAKRLKRFHKAGTEGGPALDEVLTNKEVRVMALLDGLVFGDVEIIEPILSNQHCASENGKISEDDAELNSDNDLSDDTSMYTEGPPSKAEGKAAEKDPPATSSGLHEGFRCTLCSGDIVGFRYTCVECAHCDLCASCEARGAHARHYVLRVPGPRPYSEVLAMVDRIRRDALNLLNPPEVDTTSAALSEQQALGSVPTGIRSSPVLDVREVKVKIESDDETAMDIGDTVVMSHTGQVIRDEQEAIVPKKSTATQKTPSVTQESQKSPADPTSEGVQKKLHIEIDTGQIIREATKSVIENTGGFVHIKVEPIAVPSLGGGERTKPSSPGKEETSAVTRRKIL